MLCFLFFVLLPSNQPTLHWKTLHNLRLVTNGTQDINARFFASQNGEYLLLASTALPIGLIAALKTGRTFSVDLTQTTLSEDAEYVATVTREDWTPIGSHQKRGPTLILSFQNQSLHIEPKPDLIGRVSIHQIFAHSPIYRTRAKGYQPKKPFIHFLNKFTKEIEIRVFFGNWCDHCQDVVPTWISLFQQITNPKVKITYIAVSRSLEEPKTWVNPIQLSTLPTLSVSTKERLLGIIQGEPETTIETDLLRILILAIQK